MRHPFPDVRRRGPESIARMVAGTVPSPFKKTTI